MVQFLGPIIDVKDTLPLLGTMKLILEGTAAHRDRDRATVPRQSLALSLRGGVGDSVVRDAHECGVFTVEEVLIDEEDAAVGHADEPTARTDEVVHIE